MRSILRNGAGFILFRLEQECQKSGCHIRATSLLVGEHNQFVEFYCEEHGTEAHQAFESRYLFRKENAIATRKIRHAKKSKVFKTSLTDTEIDILLANPQALSEDELKIIVDITTHRADLRKRQVDRLAYNVGKSSLQAKRP